MGQAISSNRSRDPLFDVTALRGVKVLVVEEDPASREVLDLFISACGGDTRTAACAATGMRAVAEFRPHVILSDVHTAQEDGLSFIRRVRTLPLEAGGLTPAVALSGGATAELTFGAGFHAHVAKPFDPRKLVGVIRDFAVTTRDCRASWSMRAEASQLILAFVGHVTGADMRAATGALAAYLASGVGREVVVDLRMLTGFDPSVGSAAERTVWDVRHKIEKATIVGGSPLARLVGRTACMILGIPLTLA